MTGLNNQPLSLFDFSLVCHSLKVGTHRPNRWTSEVFGETRTRSGTNLLGCSAALEAFGTTRMLSAPIQHAKSDEVGCGPSEPLDSRLCASCLTILISGVLANQCGVWDGQNTVCTLFLYPLRSAISCFQVAPPAYCISCKRRTYTLL